MQFLKDNKLIAGALAVIIALAAWMVLSGRVHAADKGGRITEQNVFADAPVAKISWTGVYVGLHGGYNAADTEISSPLGFSFDGISRTGLSGGADVGADLQVPNTCLVLGARASYTWGDVAATASFLGGSVKSSIKDGWSADGRVGCAMGTALPYLLAGYTQAGTSNNVGFPSPDLKGWRGGGGIEFLLPKMGTGPVRPTIALEYIYTDYNDNSALGGLFNANTTEQSMMVRLNLRFGQ